MESNHGIKLGVKLVFTLYIYIRTCTAIYTCVYIYICAYYIFILARCWQTQKIQPKVPKSLTQVCANSKTGPGTRRWQVDGIWAAAHGMECRFWPNGRQFERTMKSEDFSFFLMMAMGNGNVQIRHKHIIFWVCWNKPLPNQWSLWKKIWKHIQGRIFWLLGYTWEYL